MKPKDLIWYLWNCDNPKVSLPFKLDQEQKVVPMRDYKSFSHTRWDYKYHVVFIPKRRQKLIFGAIRKHLGEVFHQLENQKGIVIEEGHLMKEHVHMCLVLRPTAFYSFSGS